MMNRIKKMINSTSQSWHLGSGIGVTERESLGLQFGSQIVDVDVIFIVVTDDEEMVPQGVMGPDGQRVHVPLWLEDVIVHE